MLYFINVPYNCSDKELQEWIESRGIATKSIRMIRDLVAHVSPAFAYVELEDESRARDAISILNGKQLRNQFIQVKEAGARAASAAAYGSLKAS